MCSSSFSLLVSGSSALPSLLPAGEVGSRMGEFNQWS